jgi:hypothetical protein
MKLLVKGYVMATQTKQRGNAALALLASIRSDRSQSVKEEFFMDLDSASAFLLHDYLGTLWVGLAYQPDSEMAQFFSARDSYFSGRNYDEDLNPLLHQLAQGLLSGAFSFSVTVTFAGRKWLDCFCEYQESTFRYTEQELTKYPHCRLPCEVSNDLLASIREMTQRH